MMMRRRRRRWMMMMMMMMIPPRSVDAPSLAQRVHEAEGGKRVILQHELPHARHAPHRRLESAGWRRADYMRRVELLLTQ